MQLTLRNAGLTDLVTELREQRDRKVDLIVPGRDLWSHEGNVFVRGGGEPTLTADGVTTGNVELTASEVYDEGLSSKLRIPRAYLRELRETGKFDLIDANVNGLLHGFKAADGTLVRETDPRRFLVRTFKGQDGANGYARALLSDSYKTIDNWDVLGAVTAGMAAAGLDAHVVRQADLTNRKMYVKVVVPEIQALAPELLKNYRSPYSGNSGADNPTVFAGFVLSNSETGGGAFSITPSLEIEICTNGMTITQDAVRRTHLGAKLEDDGVVQYSNATLAKNLDLITSQTTDAVRTFLDVKYMERVIARVEHQATEGVAKPEEIVKRIVQRDAFSKSDTEGIMDAFIRGGDMTRGGVMNAITAYSQNVADADKAYAMDADAFAAAGLTGITGLVKV
jgi:hypothetical protein